MTTPFRSSSLLRLLVLPLLVCGLVSAPAGPANADRATPETAGSTRAGCPAPDDGPVWVGTWATAPTTIPAGDGTVFEDQTIRQVVRTSIGGEMLRVRLSNEFGDQPLVVGEARVALRAPGESGAAIVPDTDRQLTFSGRSSFAIPAGAPMVSDPVDLHVPPRSDLVISIYLPERTPGTTVNAFSFQENYVASGNVTAAESVEPTSTMARWYFLTGVSVSASEDAGAIVALGDSITAGANTTVNANNRWPDLLAERLHANGLDHVGVLNVGISGNRLLHDPNPPEGSPAEGYAAYFGESALSRFNRDVLAQPGARYVVVLLGVNDLGHPGTSAPLSERVSAEDIIAAHRQLIARAHQHGLTIYGGTITPFEGDTLGFYSPENEAARQTVNGWIRTSGEYDGVIDFAAAVRDPEQPGRLLPRFDSGDGLHPNDAGMEALAQAVPLQFFADADDAEPCPDLPSVAEQVEAYVAEIAEYVEADRLDTRVAAQVRAGVDRVERWYAQGEVDKVAWELRRQTRTLEQNRDLVPDDEVWDYLVEEGIAILAGILDEDAMTTGP